MAFVVEGTESLLSPKGVNYEVAALMSMKSKMNDESHVMNGWDINSVDPCTWNMVGCSSEGYVISLEMASAGLSGIISSGIGNLSHLRTLLLQNNQLSGPIPVEIGNLLELQTLDLSGNQLVGNIPSSLGSLTHLSYLRLSKNKLSGQIPQLVANLTGLSFLDLSFNNLSGPTPKILAKGYSISGNNFLCTSSSQICMGGSKPVNDTGSSSQTTRSHRHTVLSVVIGFSCTFVISVMLLAYWLHWYKSRILYSSYDERLLVYPFMPNGSVADRLRAQVVELEHPKDLGRRFKARTLFEDKRLEVLVDRDLKGCYDPVELEKAVELSIQCTQSLPSLRPKMSEVLKVLEGLIGLTMRPEESQGGGNLYDERNCSFSQNYSDVHEEPSFIIEAIELSGPR
ncbi:hypothetical protein TSUD_385230 [Trifolium subterraneum]|uniref:Uncharacterized protein n=1 Tax=Trifolium subterraneum TaxID=3900 RepID=A0A2Z6MZX0_TRISU|nr:hypothetical protein TSUD_385230 [Trifolium subterraneum]